MALTYLLSVATVPNLFLLFVAYWVIWIIYCRTLHPLARVPGPLWPAVSRTWQSKHSIGVYTMYHTYRCDAERAQAALHKKYGPLVRVSPTEVVTCDPAAIPLIYPTQNALPKSEWYVPFRPQGISEQADLFSETDEQKYSKHRRIVQPAYQMGNVLKNEEEINRATKLLVEKLKELAAKKENVDLGHWIELYTYDVIGSVMFGHEFGFLKSGNDVGSFIGAVDTAAMLLHFMAATPSYMRGVIMLAALCIPGMPKKLKAIQATAEEAKRQTELGMQRSAEESDSRHDIMSQLLRIVKDKGFKENFTHREVTLGAWIGIMAGSDSTAANMRAVLYYLMKNPRCMAAVVKEITEQEHQNLLSNPITYTESKNCLPYMGACIKEAQRLYASIGTSMPRVAPAQGIVLSGYYIPGGYDVGVNPHNAHHDTKLFGKDAKEFRPERWLESPERSFEMEKGMAFWGAGTRTCVGKNIALAEIHKLLPELLRQFDMRMAHDEPWETRTAGFIKQRNVIVTLKERV